MNCTDAISPRFTIEDLEKPDERRTPLTREQQRLAQKYLPLAKSLAKRLKLNWPSEADDFESAALHALVEAAQSFDPARNVKFATFARYRIWGALRDVQRALISLGYREDLENAPSRHSMAFDAEEHGIVVNATYDPPIGHDMEALEQVEAWLRKLPSKHSAACREIYLNERSQGDAAHALGCSKSRLSYLHKQALDILRDVVTHEYRDDNRMDSRRFRA